MATDAKALADLRWVDGDIRGAGCVAVGVDFARHVSAAKGYDQWNESGGRPGYYCADIDAICWRGYQSARWFDGWRSIIAAGYWRADRTIYMANDNLAGSWCDCW